MAVSLFALHSRHWQKNQFVYPVLSRRSRGLSIGVNLNPDAACNFDCVYCCVDRTVPPVVRTVDMGVLHGELDHMLGLACSGAIWREPPFDQTPASLRRLNDVAFSGDGEPTSYPRFGEACELAAELIAAHGMDRTKIVVITNATLLHRPAVTRAMAFLDEHNGEIWAKLDAGTQEYYQRVERTKIPLQRVLNNILLVGKTRPIVIQSLFMQLDGVGPDKSEIDAYIARLRELSAGSCGIKMVQVYTLARRAAEVYVSPLPDAAVDAITVRVRDETGLMAEAFYGVG